MEFADEINPLWVLCESLKVTHAAALIAGFEPNAVRQNSAGDFWFENEHGHTDSSGGSWVKTAFVALTTAIGDGHLKATIRRSAWERGWDEEPDDSERLTHDVRILPQDAMEATERGMQQLVRARGVIYRVEPDWNLTTVMVDDLKAWLIRRGVRSRYFFPDAASAAPGYLDRNHPRYAPKLAALVHAWMATEDTKGKTPKQAIERWLRVNAGQFDLTDEDGNPMGKTIGEISSVPNWATKGGAPKTPG